MADPDRDHVDGKLDLVPMIDCIMLLLLFFILTTKFTAPEESIASLLPTTSGGPGRPPDVLPPPTVNVRVVPAGIVRGVTAAECRSALAEQRGLPRVAWLSVGSAPPLALDADRLATPADARAEIARVHAYVRDALAKAEVDGAPRRDQPPVSIHCFSGMPWAFALMTYDACRAYEHTAGAAPGPLADARVVDLGAPRAREVADPAEELAEIASLR